MKNRLVLLGAAAALAAIALSAQSAEKCYDFSRLAVGKTFRIGDEIDISIGKVHIRDFVIDGVKYAPQADTQFLKVNQTQIAQGTSPELHIAFVNVQIIPSQPATKVTMKLAQQLGVTGQLPANLGVNGDLHDFRGSFEKVDGKHLGSSTRGRAEVKVNLVPDPSTPENPSYWHRGTLGIRALSGGIESISFGAQLMNFDNICFDL